MHPMTDLNTTTPTQLLGHEWSALHRDCEAAERSALWIKLAAVALTVWATTWSVDTALALVLLAVLWLQEAIVRTGQARLVDRLLQVEALLRDGAAGAAQACQLYSQWQAGRPGLGGLLGQYLAAALRPTVAFPYVVLLVLLGAVVAIE
jgi:hypothetical protein